MHRFQAPGRTTELGLAHGVNSSLGSARLGTDLRALRSMLTHLISVQRAQLKTQGSLVPSPVFTPAAHMAGPKAPGTPASLVRVEQGNPTHLPGILQGQREGLRIMGRQVCTRRRKEMRASPNFCILPATHPSGTRETLSQPHKGTAV